MCFLGLDGWISPAGQSLYIFVVITSDQREYMYFLKNFLKDLHTAEFLKDEIIQVIDEIGAKKFCSVIFNHAANVALAKKLVSEKYLHILPMQCIAHHINLLTNNIMKINWAVKIITNCRKVVIYFT